MNEPLERVVPDSDATPYRHPIQRRTPVEGRALTPKRTPQWHGVPVSVREVQRRTPVEGRALTPKRTPQWHGVPVSVREVQPKDAWRDQSSLAGATHVASPLVEFESRLPATERAQ